MAANVLPIAAGPADRDWANICTDVLEMIAEKMNHVIDYAAFRSVCTTFHSVAPCCKLPPLLMFPYDNNSQSIAFYDPSSGDVRSAFTPECQDTIFCGASHGWMVRMDANARIFLFNPFTRICIQLPRATPQLAAASDHTVIMTDDSVLLRNAAGQLLPLGLRCMNTVFINDAILSASPYEPGADCVVLAILGSSSKVAFCRPWDACWTIMETGLRNHVRAAAYCHSRFYLADNQNLAVLDVGVMPRVDCFHRLPYLQRSGKFRLVEWEGELLLMFPMVLQIDENWHFVDGLGWQCHVQLVDAGMEEEEEEEGEEVGGEGQEEEEEEHQESDEDVYAQLDALAEDEDEDEEYNFQALEKYNIYRLDALNSTWTKLPNLGQNTVFWSQYHCWTMIRGSPEGCRVGNVYGSTLIPDVHELLNPEQHYFRVVRLVDGLVKCIPCNWIASEVKSIVWFKPRLQ